MATYRFMFGQWTLTINDGDATTPDTDVIDCSSGSYRMENRGDAGDHNDIPRWFALVMGAYNAPVFDPEPELRLAAPDGLEYVTANGVVRDAGDLFITGFICQGENGPRASLTNAAMKGTAVVANDNGSFTIDGAVYWLHTLFHKDGQRFSKNCYDAFLGHERPTVVRVLELGDLPLFQS